MSEPNVMRVDEPRSDGTPEWEVFLSDDPAEPLRHAGSVSAPSVSVAYDHASSLFGWAADAVWLCPAAEVERFTDRTLGAAADPDSEGAETTPTETAEPAGTAGSESGGDRT